MAFAAGDRIGAYQIIALLGTGGMGEVYKARDTRLNRIVALKTLPIQKLAVADRKRRFLVEAQAASRLNHPNIVTIYDISEQKGLCFITMEYIAGVTLEQAIAGAGLPLHDAMKYAAEITDALIAGHSAGIVHRDLKPANIIISEEGRVKLLDFGLAKLSDPIAPPDEAETAALRTMPGTIMGTAAYMSPEQAEGREIDPRYDIFAFGLVLYEMLSGQRAFQGRSWISTLAAILNDEPRSLRDIKSTIPPLLARQVERCLRKDPAHRFQSMIEVKQALVEALSSAGSSSGVAAARPASPATNTSANKKWPHPLPFSPSPI